MQPSSCTYLLEPLLLGTGVVFTVLKFVVLKNYSTQPPTFFIKNINANTMNLPQIGWVGLGNMGNAIVLNLLKHGCAVNVYNRTKDKEKDAVQAGAKSQ